MVELVEMLSDRASLIKRDAKGDGEGLFEGRLSKRGATPVSYKVSQRLIILRISSFNLKNASPLLACASRINKGVQLPRRPDWRFASP